MNICILSGKVVNEIKLKFIYNKSKKNLGKKHISIVQIILELDNKQTVLVHAYNEIADFIYREVQKEEHIMIKGKVRENYVEIEFCEMIS